MLKKRTDTQLAQTKCNQNIDIDLQLSLLNAWTQRSVEDYYQNIVLAYLDQLQPKQAEKFMRKEEKLTYQRKSPYFQLSKTQKQRGQILEKLHNLVQSRSQEQILTKLPKISEKIKQLREVNVEAAEQILKMYHIYHCKQIQSTDKQMKQYSSMLNSLHKDNQFIRRSPLNNQLILNNEYDPFLMDPYERINRVQDQSINPNIKQLFSMNLRQVHRLIKVKKLVQELFSITKGNQEPPAIRENKRILSHKRFYNKQSQQTQRSKHNLESEIHLPRINKIRESQSPQSKQLARRSINNFKKIGKLMNISQHNSKNKLRMSNDSPFNQNRQSKTDIKFKLETGKIKIFKTQHNQRYKDIDDSEPFKIDADDFTTHKRQISTQLKEKIKMIGNKKLDLSQILRGRRLNTLKKNDLKDSATKEEDQIQQDEIQEDSNVGLMKQIPLKRHNKRRRPKDKIMFSKKYQEQLKKQFSVQKDNQQAGIQFQQQKQKEQSQQSQTQENTLLQEDNKINQIKDQNAERIGKLKVSGKDERKLVKTSHFEQQPEYKTNKTVQNDGSIKQVQKQKVNKKIPSNQQLQKEIQVRTQLKVQNQSPNRLKTNKFRQLINPKESLSTRQKNQVQSKQDKSIIDTSKQQEAQRVAQRKKTSNQKMQDQQAHKFKKSQKDHILLLKQQSQNEKNKKIDDKSNLANPKQNNQSLEKKKTSVINNKQIHNPNAQKVQNKSKNTESGEYKNQKEGNNLQKTNLQNRDQQSSKKLLIKNDQKKQKERLIQNKNEQKIKIKQQLKNSIVNQQKQKKDNSEEENINQKRKLQEAVILSKQGDQKKIEPTKQIEKKPIVNQQQEEKHIQPTNQMEKGKAVREEQEKQTKKEIKKKLTIQLQKVPIVREEEQSVSTKEKDKELAQREEKQKQPTKKELQKQLLQNINDNSVNQPQRKQTESKNKLVNNQQNLQSNHTPSQKIQNPAKQSKQKSLKPEQYNNQNEQRNQNDFKQSKPKQKNNFVVNKEDEKETQNQNVQNNCADTQKPSLQNKISNPKDKNDFTEKNQKSENSRANQKQRKLQMPKNQIQSLKEPKPFFIHDQKIYQNEAQPLQLKVQNETPKKTRRKPIIQNFQENENQVHQQNVQNKQLEPKTKPSQNEPQKLQQIKQNAGPKKMRKRPKINKQENDQTVFQNEAQKLQQKVQNEAPKKTRRKPKIKKFQENENEIPKQNAQNEQLKPKIKASNDKINQNKQDQNQLPSIQKIIFSPVDSQQDQQVLNQNNREIQANNKPQIGKQQSLTNTSPLRNSLPKQQEGKQKAELKNQPKDHMKQNEYKNIKMKMGKSTLQEIIEFLNKLTLPEEYKASFDIKKLISWIRVSQTYLTKFTIQEQEVLIGLCSPVVNKGLVLMLWAPLSPKINFDISSYLFKKYIELLQKYTTSSKIVFHGKPFKQLQAGEFTLKKQNLYQRPRKNSTLIEQQEFQSFLYIECSNIRLQNKTKDKILYSQQIESFKAQNCYCANFITQVNDKSIPSPLKSLMKYTPDVENMTKIDQILKPQKFDGYEAKNVQITDIDLIRFYLNTYLKTPFLAQDFYFKFFGYLLYQKGKECLVCVSLLKNNGFIYFAKNLDFPKLLQIIKTTTINDKKQNFFKVMMFNKKLFGKMPNNPGCYGNWEINLLWEDQLQGNIKHDIKQAISFGPQNFKVLIQLEKVVVLGFQVSEND